MILVVLGTDCFFDTNKFGKYAADQTKLSKLLNFAVFFYLNILRANIVRNNLKN